MTRRERYRSDPEFRAMINKRNRDAYHRNMLDPVRSKIHATLARIRNARVSLEHHEKRAQFFYDRIRNDLKLIERLRAERGQR